jgi:pyrimidine operon attenuation protein/uracil phosphoribosyltransferase
MKRQRRILSAEDMTRTIERLAFEIIERHDQGCGLALIGIQRRGVELAQRVKKVLEGRLGCDILSGKLDINLYRDDWTHSNVRRTSARPTSPSTSTTRKSSWWTTCSLHRPDHPGRPGGHPGLRPAAQGSFWS